MITKSIINWNDKKFEESLEERGPKSMIKAFLCGFLEGVIDGAFGVGIVLIVSGIWLQIKAKLIK